MVEVLCKNLKTALYVHIVNCCSGIVLSGLNLAADNSRAAEIAVVESDKSICSQSCGVEGETF